MPASRTIRPTRGSLLRFKELGGAAQEDGALRGRDRGESGRGAVANVERYGDFAGSGMAGEADNVVSVGGVQYRLAWLVFRSAGGKARQAI